MAYKMGNLHLLQNATALMTICVSCNKMPQRLLKNASLFFS